MKQINIFSLVVFVLLNCATQLPAKAKTEKVEQTEEEVAADNIKAIISNHTRVFSKENLLLSSIPSEEHQAWMGLIQNLKDYVRNRQPDVIRIPSNDLFRIGEQVEDVISSIFTEDIAPAFTSEKAQREGISASGITQEIDYSKIGIDTRKLNLQAITKKLARLKDFKKNLAAYQKTFQPDTSKKNLTQKARNEGIRRGIIKPKTAAEGCVKVPEVCSVLDAFVAILDATIDKTVRDFEKMKTGFGLA